MGQALLDPVIRYLRHAAAPFPGPEQTDAELLERFLRRGDESAFAALVRRYGPLVLGVCRRALGHEQDAEDAFQATLLVLATRARSIRKRMGHAGAILSGGSGSARDKIAALRAAGILAADSPAYVGATVQRAMGR